MQISNILENSWPINQRANHSHNAQINQFLQQRGHIVYLKKQWHSTLPVSTVLPSITPSTAEETTVPIAIKTLYACWTNKKLNLKIVENVLGP